MKDLSNLSAALEADSALRAAQARAKIAEAKDRMSRGMANERLLV